MPRYLFASSFSPRYLFLSHVHFLLQTSVKCPKLTPILYSQESGESNATFVAHRILQMFNITHAIGFPVGLRSL